MKCSACGNENRTGAKFCARCGKSLAEVMSSPPPIALLESPAEDDAPAASAAQASALEATPEPAMPEAEPPAPTEGPLPAVPPTDKATDELETADTTPPADEEPAIGTRLLDRYELVELVESGPSGKVYAAYDLRRCPRCSYAGNEPGSEYCAQCGLAITSPAKCLVRAQPAAGQTNVADQFVEGECLYTVTLEPGAEPDVVVPDMLEGVGLRWGKETDVGRARQINEDALDVRIYASSGGPTLGLFVVADGVGGQEHGEVASKLATDVIWQTIRERVWQPEMSGQEVSLDEMKEIVREAIRAANQAVYKQRVRSASDMGTTVTMALLRDTAAAIANVGDSRTYLWSAEGLRRLTVDHSVVESLVASGEIKRDQVYTHPQRNLIYRSLGDSPRVEVDVFTPDLEPGNRLILCSDGLWEMVRDDGLEEVLLSEADPQRACEVLVDRANLAGGEDNITVIIVQIEEND